jgi:hypothetical protein
MADLKHTMRARDLLSDKDATLVLSYGWEVMDAETLLNHAPFSLLSRLARNAGCIDRVTLWDTQDPEEGFALTLPNTIEIMSAFREHLGFLGVEED